MPGFAVISVHVSPASVDFQRPLLPPPASIPHAVRWNFHIEAKMMRGLEGSIEISLPPVESLMKRIFFHDFPPSIVR